MDCWNLVYGNVHQAGFCFTDTAPMEYHGTHMEPSIMFDMYCNYIFIKRKRVNAGDKIKYQL